MKVSVVVVSYRRQNRLNDILSAWLGETPDVWLCDCSRKGFKTDLPIKYIYANPDPGNKIRHAIATLTTGDIVIKADDDIIPFPGLATDFAKNMEAVGPAILGVHGRRFFGDGYYSKTFLYGSKGVFKGIYEQEANKPQEVDFCGVITCAPRQFLAMDLRGCNTEVEDLYWQCEIYPQVKKYVISTENYTNLQESKDAERLCAPHSESRQKRQEYYKVIYERNYKNRSNNR